MTVSAGAVAEGRARCSPTAHDVPDAVRVRRALLRWFGRHRRDFVWRDGPGASRLTPFQVLLVELLLWKTNAARSHDAIRCIVKRYPQPAVVLRRSRRQLEAELRPLGLFRRRAHCMLALSRQLAERHAGVVPTSVAELSALTGVGQYAARATACLLSGSRLMPVDANTTRIFGRLFGREGPGVRTPGPGWDRAMDPFVPRRNPRAFLWATMDLGAALCTARDPRCAACPLRRECVTGRAHLAAAAGA
jgi:A/G-specific adenine glycosylase